MLKCIRFLLLIEENKEFLEEETKTFAHNSKPTTQSQYLDTMLAHFLKKPETTCFFQTFLPHYTKTFNIHIEYWKISFWLILT